MRPLLILLLAALLPAAVSVSGPATIRGTVGVPLAAAIIASGGAPLTYDDALALPPGLVLDPATGRITGTPTAAGITAVPLTASDGTTSATLPSTVTIDAAAGPSVVNAGAWAVSDGSRCSLQLIPGAASTGFSASGQPAGLSISAGGLLAGLAGTPGIYNIEVSADAGTTFTTLVLEVTTAQPGAPLFTIPVQPVAAEGVPFAAYITASLADTFTATDKPAWLSIDQSDGLLSGTPPAGSASANLRLTASIGGAAATTVMAVPIAVPVAGDPLPASPPVIEATVSSGLGWKATASAVATWSAVGLPAGLTIDAASGRLLGSPSASGSVSAVITATPTLPALLVSSTIALRVRPAAAGAPQLSTLVPPVLTVGSPGAIAVITSGGVPTSYAATGTADFAIDGDGLISGTPAAAGMQAVTLSASNASGTAVATLLLQTQARIAAAPAPTAPVAFHATAGSRFAATLTADAAVTTWLESGVPAGLALSAFTGRITGLAAAGVSNVFLSASDADGSNPTHAAIRALAATAGAPVISDAGPWMIGAGQPVRLQLGVGYAAAWTVAGLPAGLAADGDGLITGSTSATGDSTLTLTAVNASGQTRTCGLLVVEAAPAGTPVFSDPGVLVATVGTAFTGTLAASLSPIEYTVVGGPAWLTVVPATGVLGGTPTAVGTWLLTITARNAAGTARTTAILRVDPAPTPPVTPPVPPAPAAPVSSVGGGGCGAGAAGLVLLLVLAGLGFSRPAPPRRATRRR